MRRDRITPGIILVLIGAVVLLRNFGYLHFHWSNLIYMWPIFLVIGGVNLIFAHNRSIWASIIKITVVAGGLCLVLFGDFGHKFRFLPHIYFNNHHHDDNDMDDSDNDDDDDDSDTVGAKGLVKIEGSSYYHTPYTADVKVATLNLSGGGNSFSLSDTTSDLFTANVKDAEKRYEMVSHKTDSTGVVDFKMRDQRHNRFDWGNNKSSSATIKLNAAPEWNMSVKAGATDLDFDLSKFKVRSFDLSGGAASFKVKLGPPTASNTNVKVSSGVSDITVSVPKDAACSVVSSTGLSSNSFDGFTKTSDNHYETPGFGSASKRIYITINGGLSDFKVNRY